MAEKYCIKWAAPAREDLEEIIEYIAKTNVNNAIKILDKIEEAVNKLDVIPGRGRIVAELEEFGYLLYHELIVDYWRIIYKIENDIVYIVMVIDGRRNIEDIILKKIIIRESGI